MSSHSEGLSPKIFIVDDYLKEFALWLSQQQKYNGYVIPISVDTILSKYKGSTVDITQTPIIPTEQPIVPQVGTEEVVSIQPALTASTPEQQNNVGVTLESNFNQNPQITQQNEISNTVAPTTASNGIAPIDHSLDPIPKQQNNAPTLTRKPSGFVKFPIFLLTIIAIAAIGIFVGKLVFTYFGQS